MQKVLGYILVPWLLLLPTMMNAFAGIGQVTEYKGNSIIERDGNTITTSDGVDVEQMDTAITTNGIMRIDFIVICYYHIMPEHVITSTWCWDKAE